MGWIDGLKQKIGSHPQLDPEIERVIDEELRNFVKEQFIGHYIRCRVDHGFTKEAAERVVLGEILSNVENPKLKDAAIRLVAALARCHFVHDKRGLSDPELDKQLLAGTSLKFRRNELIRMMAEQMVEVSAAAHSQTASPRSA